MRSLGERVDPSIEERQASLPSCFPCIHRAGMEFMKAGISPIVPLILILIIWLSFQFYMMKKPLRDLHEGYINRQIGRTAHNHLVLGLSRTKGANVTVVRQDGTLDIHTSYSPLASWVTALPLRFGVPFDAATQGTAIVHVLVFLVAFRTFIYHLYGALRANVALAYAAFFPVVLFFYGRSCIFEVLASGHLWLDWPSSHSRSGTCWFGSPSPLPSCLP